MRNIGEQHAIIAAKRCLLKQCPFVVMPQYCTWKMHGISQKPHALHVQPGVELADIAKCLRKLLSGRLVSKLTLTAP